MSRRRFALAQGLAASALLLGLGACARSPKQAETVRSLSLDRQSVNLIVGDTTTLSLIAGSPAIAMGGVRWRSQDERIVSVSAEQGFLTARGPGATRIWAVIGVDSVSAIAIVEAPTAQFVHDPRSVNFDAVGALADLRIVSVGREPLPTGDLATFCTSDDERIAIVAEGPTITSRGNGRTYVRCVIGETADSTLVEVAQRAVRVAVVASSLRPIRLANDSITISLARVDRLGAPIPDAQPTWRSLDERIVLVNALGVARGVALGIGEIVGELHGLADTIPIEVRASIAEEETPGLPSLAFVSGPAPEDAVEVTEAVGPIEVTEEVIDIEAQRQEIAELVIGPQAPTRETVGGGRFAAAIEALVGYADHRTNIGFGPEVTSGPVFGGEIGLRWGRIGLRSHAYGGTLSSSTGATEDRKIIDVRAVASLTTLPWLDFEVGGTFRRYTVFNDQNWGSLSIGAVGRLDALDGAISGSLGFSLLPAVRVSTLTATPNLGIVGRAEVTYRLSRLTASLGYELERYTFPASGGTQLVEQYSVLGLRVGIRLGKR